MIFEPGFGGNEQQYIVLNQRLIVPEIEPRTGSQLVQGGTLDLVSPVVDLCCVRVRHGA